MKFSAAVEGVGQAVSIRYNNRVYELQRKGKHVIVLSLGEAFFDIPLFSFEELPYPALYHYSHSRGLPELREQIAQYFAEEYGVPVDPNKEIVVTAGSKIAIHMAFMSVLNPGDEVIVPEPAWVSYMEQINLCLANPIGVPMDTPVSRIKDFITTKTKAIVINTPHNPRGYVYSEKELTELLDLCAKNDIWLFSDEAYSDFVDDGSFVSVGSIDLEKKHSVVFNSISKNYGISGWRIGYAIGHDQFITQLLKVNQHLITCSPTALSYYVAKHFSKILEITKPQIKGVLRKRREIQKYMAELGLQYMPGDATFYFFVSIAPSRLSSEAFCTRLLEEHLVSAVPGSGYGRSCDQYIRVSIGTATMEENRLGLQLIKQLIDRTR